jgi:transcriptional regulator with PAS, ATPase and Fis domain
VVVTGETGTGKEIVAHLIHRRSGRPGPFVAVNCAGFTESLLASELFGHVRGAFTGAIAEQPGLFRAAHGGTLFLDEAGDIPVALQATLLRVLETWNIRPVGSTRDVPVDVRVVAASNRDLVTLVRKGLFRADLYSRLAQWTIHVPALRERREDIPALSRALLSQHGAGERTLTPDLEEALLVHPWPLNVRGLANVLSVAAIATPAGLPLGLCPEVQSALDDNLVEGSVAPPEVASFRARSAPRSPL